MNASRNNRHSPRRPRKQSPESTRTASRVVRSRKRGLPPSPDVPYPLNELPVEKLPGEGELEGDDNSEIVQRGPLPLKREAAT